jgi:hypothetical protein
MPPISEIPLKKPLLEKKKVHAYEKCGQAAIADQRCSQVPTPNLLRFVGRGSLLVSTAVS